MGRNTKTRLRDKKKIKERNGWRCFFLLEEGRRCVVLGCGGTGWRSFVNNTWRGESLSKVRGRKLGRRRERKGVLRGCCGRGFGTVEIWTPAGGFRRAGKGAFVHFVLFFLSSEVCWCHSLLPPSLLSSWKSAVTIDVASHRLWSHSCVSVRCVTPLWPALRLCFIWIWQLSQKWTFQIQSLGLRCALLLR